MHSLSPIYAIVCPIYAFRQLNRADIKHTSWDILLHLALNCTAVGCFEIVIQGISAVL